MMIHAQSKLYYNVTYLGTTGMFPVVVWQSTKRELCYLGSTIRPLFQQLKQKQRRCLLSAANVAQNRGWTGLIFISDAKEIIHSIQAKTTPPWDSKTTILDFLSLSHSFLLLAMLHGALEM